MTNKVLLCVTLKTDLWPDWFMGYNNIRMFGKGYSTEVIQIYDFRADEARNRAFWAFKEQKQYDHLLFLDSDVVIPEDTIPRLLAQKKDIVGGLYMLKAFPFPPTMYEWHQKADENGENFLYRIILDYERGKMVKCDALATGCMMVSRKVLELPSPWFSFKEGGTEDTYFCRRAQEKGFEIWCDTSIECQHLRVAAVGVGDYWGALDKMGGMDAMKKALYKEWLQRPWLKEDKGADEGEFGETAA